MNDNYDYPQNGDSAVIIAIMHNRPAILRQLVRAGSDLNLQNQVSFNVRQKDTLNIMIVHRFMYTVERK